MQWLKRLLCEHVSATRQAVGGFRCDACGAAMDGHPLGKVTPPVLKELRKEVSA